MTLVEYEVRKKVAWLTLNAPPANTYSYEMMQDFDKGVLQARFDKNINVIVITGKGDKFFSAGADISMLATADPAFKYYFCLHANETLNRLEHTAKLTIAAINGHCVGGGLEIAMAADLRIAKKDAGQLGLPEVTLGVLPGTGGTQRLSRMVGKSKAIELMTTGKLLNFEEGVQLGIVNKIFDSANFEEKIQQFASEFCAPNKAAKAVGLIKRSVQSGWEVGFSDGLAIERECQQQLFTSEDAKNGIQNWIQTKGKGKVEFKGS
ncbi:MAG: enoyl-CoA hydratase/isomerase family protein [Planctomycetes bacterium]|nr:enoyl-CoA hydratase/isomerase family protein [Planctomycetota bacterium]